MGKMGENSNDTINYPLPIEFIFRFRAKFEQTERTRLLSPLPLPYRFTHGD